MNKIELYVYDLIMFRSKETKAISLETIHTIYNYFNGSNICETNNFIFNGHQLKVIDGHLKHLRNWYELYDDNIEIVGIWRFNNQTKNYEVVYYNDINLY